jgi:hypothetical protein
MAPPTTAFANLLHAAVTEPGIISTAYRQFHTYSIGNQLLAWAQCQERGIEPGPINTFPGWRALGRWVCKGERAISLCMPMTVKRKRDTDPTDDAETVTWFVCRPRWFVLAQTEGEPLPEPDIPSWDRQTALEGLDIREIQYTYTDGNCMGYARERSIAINPVNPMPHKTRFHELAHVLLGHTAEGQQANGEVTPRNLRECEAEAVALLCCAALALPGTDEARGYIQSWWGHAREIPEPSARRVLRVADQILKAGTTGGQ